MGNAYLQHKKTILKDAATPVDPVFIDRDDTRLVNIAFVYTFKEFKHAKTKGGDIEHINLSDKFQRLREF